MKNQFLSLLGVQAKTSSSSGREFPSMVLLRIQHRTKFPFCTEGSWIFVRISRCCLEIPRVVCSIFRGGRGRFDTKFNDCSDSR
jgi:hypothetical protein